MRRSAWGGDASGVPWWRVALGYARVIARDTYARGVALALAAWVAARWQVPEAVQWVDTAWALLAALLGAGLAVERVRSGAAASALDASMKQGVNDRSVTTKELWRVRDWAAWGLALREGARLTGAPLDPEVERQRLVVAVEGILSSASATDTPTSSVGR